MVALFLKLPDSQITSYWAQFSWTKANWPLTLIALLSDFLLAPLCLFCHSLPLTLFLALSTLFLITETHTQTVKSEVSLYSSLADRRIQSTEEHFFFLAAALFHRHRHGSSDGDDCTAIFLPHLTGVWQSVCLSLSCTKCLFFFSFSCRTVCSSFAPHSSLLPRDTSHRTVRSHTWVKRAHIHTHITLKPVRHFIFCLTFAFACAGIKCISASFIYCHWKRPQKVLLFCLV